MTKSPLPLFGEALTKSEALRRAIGEAALRAATDVHLTPFEALERLRQPTVCLLRGPQSSLPRSAANAANWPAARRPCRFVYCCLCHPCRSSVADQKPGGLSDLRTIRPSFTEVSIHAPILFRNCAATSGRRALGACRLTVIRRSRKIPSKGIRKSEVGPVSVMRPKEVPSIRKPKKSEML